MSQLIIKDTKHIDDWKTYKVQTFYLSKSKLHDQLKGMSLIFKAIEQNVSEAAHLITYWSHWLLSHL